MGVSSCLRKLLKASLHFSKKVTRQLGLHGVSPLRDTPPLSFDHAHVGPEHALELLSDLLQGAVDMKLRSLPEGLLAYRALVAPVFIPVSADAGHAETMTTGGGDRGGEDVQADGAQELLL